MKKVAQALLMLVCLAIGIGIGGAVVGWMPQILPKGLVALNPIYLDYQHMKERYGKIENAYDKLDKYYYEEIDSKKLEEAMLKGLFEGTQDPYTTYMNPMEYENFMIKSTGELQGIGVSLAPDKDNNIVVISTFKDSPAETGGIKAGDIITKVNGVEYKAGELDKAVSEMRGEAGTKVEVSYIREGKENTLRLLRKKITLQSVFAKKLESDIGYIGIGSFEANTPQEFEMELHNFEMNNAKGLVIDLRQNGGGIVESGIEIADMLLDEGVLAYTKGKDNEKIFMNVEKGKTALPYVVLIDEGTASTSEIVAAGIKDNKGGKIVGSKSFGKGVIQTIIKLPTKDAIKITIAQYFSPKGTKIHGVGVKPDYYIDLPEDAQEDLQLKKAIEVLKKEM